MSVQIMQGDCRDVLATLDAGCVHACITSPPYFGQRNYNGGAQEIGTAQTPREYVHAVVEAFQGVRRILRDDGLLFVVLGDSYSRAKDLMLMPHRVALALQDAGWTLRSDIIWSKSNPLPESVRDRPTVAHEHIFMLAKTPHYYFDQRALAEPATTPTRNASEQSRTRNVRTVWDIPTQSFSARSLGITDVDHFAAFPEELARRLICVSTSATGCCANCGTPFRRVVVRGELAGEARIQQTSRPAASERDVSRGSLLRTNGRTWREYSDLGFTAGCSCAAGDPRPCTVLDCFAGAGTTGLVAQRLGRDAILIELNAQYCALAERRLAGPPAVSNSAEGAAR